jgi:predicted TIM-barrel fold metal-dependent hydrolase
MQAMREGRDGEAAAIDWSSLVLVSVDDHVVEPPGMFDGRLPARYADRAPHVAVGDDGEERWVFEGAHWQNIGLNAVVGRRIEDYGVEPQSYADMRAGCYDSDARVADMSANGVLASMCFPTFPKFAGTWFLTSADLDLACEVVRAYNDWHVDEWCGAHPDRFIPLGIVPLWDADAAAVEVRRLAARGCHAITFPENPVPLGLPSLHSAAWNPLWAACDEAATVVCMHFGSSSKVPITAPDAPIEVMVTLNPYSMGSAATDLVLSGILARYPQLTFALSEGGMGWVPYIAERMDWVYDRHRAWTGLDLGAGVRPSDLLRERVVKCFISDHHGIAMREEIGLDTITWECDYPHSDTTWPLSPESVADQLQGCSRADIDAITHRNAMRVFHFDPFPTRPLERCTVRALREEAAAISDDLSAPVLARSGRGQTGVGK